MSRFPVTPERRATVSTPVPRVQVLRPTDAQLLRDSAALAKYSSRVSDYKRARVAATGADQAKYMQARATLRHALDGADRRVVATAARRVAREADRLEALDRLHVWEHAMVEAGLAEWIGGTP